MYIARLILQRTHKHLFTMQQKEERKFSNPYQPTFLPVPNPNVALDRGDFPYHPSLLIAYSFFAPKKPKRPLFMLFICSSWAFFSSSAISLSHFSPFSRISFSIISYCFMPRSRI